jgi:hypothetical protein
MGVSKALIAEMPNQPIDTTEMTMIAIAGIMSLPGARRVLAAATPNPLAAAFRDAG